MICGVPEGDVEGSLGLVVAFGAPGVFRLLGLLYRPELLPDCGILPPGPLPTVGRVGFIGVMFGWTVVLPGPVPPGTPAPPVGAVPL